MKKVHSFLGVVPYRFMPAFKGGDKDILHLLSALGERGVMNCICMNTEIKDDVPFNLYRILGNSKLRYINPFLIFTYHKKMKESKANTLLVFHPFIAWQAVLLRRFTSFTLIVRSQNIEYKRFKSFSKWYWVIIRALERWVHRKADLNLFISEEDTQYASHDMKVPSAKCLFVPYGVEQNVLCSEQELSQNREAVLKEHGIAVENRLILFNGTLNYLPNERAVEKIVDTVHPILKESLENYTIIICGKGLNEDLRSKIDATPEIVYTGFVEDIDLYFKACDLLLNPVIEGGGVKTKLVEALGFGKYVVSYKSGSYGADPSITNGRLRVIEDYDAKAMSEALIEVLSTPLNDDNNEFFDIHHWGNIADLIIKRLDQMSL